MKPVHREPIHREPIHREPTHREPIHREEGRFTIRIELSAEFDEDYEGDDDGYAWLARFRDAIRPRVARAVFDALRSDPSFRAVPTSRGASPDENLEIDVRFLPDAQARTGSPPHRREPPER